MVELIASDLDETLLTSDKHVGDYTRFQIQKAQEKGIFFVCATGRPFFSVQNTLKKIGQYNKNGCYTIALNGATVFENTNKILCSFPLKKEIAEKLFQIGRQHNVCIHIYTVDATYVYNLNKDEEEFLDGRMEVQKFNQDNLDFLKNKEIIKVLFENTDLHYLRTIEDSLPAFVKENCSLSYSSNRYFEFNTMGVDKGMGLKFLCDHLHIDIKNTVAIGDNYNDLGMLKKAGISVGVKNILPALKDEVDLISSYSHDEDGVGHIIEDLIKK